MHSRLRPIVTIAWISLALGGCASTKESVLPQDGPSMKAIYDAHFEGMGADDPYVLRRELGTRPMGDDGPGHDRLGRVHGGRAQRVAAGGGHTPE